MKAKSVLSLLVLGGFPLALAAQNLVSLPEKRETLLAGIDAVLHPPAIDIATATVARANPFAAVEHVVVANEPEGPASVRDLSANDRLPDPVALQAASANFRPAGSIIGNTRRVLRLANGEMLDEGKGFRATIRGREYFIQIERITVDGYVLRLGDAQLERSFLDLNTTNGAIRSSSGQSPES